MTQLPAVTSNTFEEAGVQILAGVRKRQYKTWNKQTRKGKMLFVTWKWNLIYFISIICTRKVRYAAAWNALILLYYKNQLHPLPPFFWLLLTALILDSVAKVDGDTNTPNSVLTWVFQSIRAPPTPTVNIIPWKETNADWQGGRARTGALKTLAAKYDARWNHR